MAILPSLPQLGTQSVPADPNSPIPSGFGFDRTTYFPGGGGVPIGPGVSRSPDVDASSLMQSISIPPDIDPSEIQHLQIVADLLASHINQGNLSYADAAKNMRAVVQSVRTTPQTAAPAPAAAPPAGVTPSAPPTTGAAPTMGLNANATPLPGTGSPQLTPGSLPAPTPPHPGTAPTGRSFSEIQASGKYQSLAEREWYLNQINRTVGRNGLPVPRPNLPPPEASSFGTGTFGSATPHITPPDVGGGVPSSTPLRMADDGSAIVPDYAHGGTAQLSPAQVSAIRTVFPPSEWDMAMEVAAAESHGDNNATGTAGERGIFQIHPVNWQNLGVDSSALQDPFRSAEAAYKLWESDGWQPWTTAPLIRAATARQ